MGDEVDTTDVIEADEKACAADTESYLTVQLVGADAKEGKTFTSTFEDGQPLTIRLGQNQLILRILRKEAILPVEWAVCLGVGFLIAGIVWFVAARLYHREQLAISG